MNTILLATSNTHKLAEILAVIQDPDLQITTLAQAGIDLPEPVEDQPTFEGNAILKATYYAQASSLPCFADDSGLEVDALDGQPGVYSARYSGQTGSREVVDQANNQKLLQELGNRPPEQRTARFVCAMAFCQPDPTIKPIVVRGTIEGQILTAPRGQNGFGYDPLFFVPDLGKTTAELSPDHKNKISHRGQAARLIWKKMKAQGWS